MGPGVDKRPLYDIAAPRYGIITRDQLVAAGWRDKAIERLTASGELQRVHEGIYRFTAAIQCTEQKLMVAQEWCGREGYVSHRAAGRWYGLDGVPDGFIEVTARQTWGGAPPPGVLVHFTRRLDVEDIRTFGELRVGSPERTMIELAAVLTRVRLRLALDDVIRKDLSDAARIDNRLAELGCRGRRGAGRLKFELATRAPIEGRQEKGLETKFLRLVKRFGRLPLPTPQFRIYDRLGFIMRIDFAYPARRLGIEIDSKKFHKEDERFDLDRDKQNRLTALGWMTLRFTKRHLDQPERALGVLYDTYVSRPVSPF